MLLVKFPGFKLLCSWSNQAGGEEHRQPVLVDHDRTLGSVKNEGPIATKRLLLAGPGLWGGGPRARFVMDII